jgi:DNA-binding beta-propeller fold protein YncE
MAIDRSNQLLYVQDVGDFKPKIAGGDMVYIVDIRKRSVEKKINVGPGAARPQFAISGKYLFAGDKGYKEGKGFTTVIDLRTLAARYHLVFPKKVNDYVINQKSNKLYAISYKPRPPTLTVLQLLEPDDQ